MQVYLFGVDIDKTYTLKLSVLKRDLTYSGVFKDFGGSVIMITMAEIRSFFLLSFNLNVCFVYFAEPTTSSRPEKNFQKNKKRQKTTTITQSFTRQFIFSVHCFLFCSKHGK